MPPPQPDALIKKNSIEARVFLDDKIKADAVLAADCLAEGKKWIDKNAGAMRRSRSDDVLSNTNLLTALW